MATTEKNWKKWIDFDLMADALHLLYLLVA